MYFVESELLDVPLSGHGHSRTLSSSSGSSFYGNRSHGKTPDIDSRGTDSKPKRILFIEKLIETVRTTLPHLFKLGQAYFNQALFPVSQLCLSLSHFDFYLYRTFLTRIRTTLFQRICTPRRSSLM